jgi:SAM-dependent methyltransferase
LRALQRLGFSGTGIDLNENMLAYARARSEDIDFERRDMRSLGYEAQFDAAFSLCTTFSYNTTNEEIAAALNSIYKSLRKKGVLVIETFNPISFIDKLEFLRHIEQREIYEGHGVFTTIDHEIDERNQHLIETRSIYDAKTGEERQSDVTRFRLFFPQEMRYFLETNGFDFKGFYGSYDKDDQDLGKFRLITISTRS